MPELAKKELRFLLALDFFLENINNLVKKFYSESKFSNSSYIYKNYLHKELSDLYEKNIKNIKGIKENIKNILSCSSKPLTSIFQNVNIKDSNVSSEEKNCYVYPLKPLEITSLEELEKTIFPTVSKQVNYEKDYESLISNFLEDLRKLEKENSLYHLISKLYYLLYKYTWCISVDVPNNDISFFDYIRLNAAIISSLVNNKDSKFILIEGDVSGIQKFLFDIKNYKGSTRRLRARSFFISVLPEIISRYILKNLSYHPVINTLFIGAGKFQILVGYEEGIEELLRDLEKTVLKTLLKEFKGKLGFVMSYVTLEKDIILENSKEKSSQSSLFENLKKLSEDLNKRKKRKFSLILEELDNLMKDNNNNNGTPKKICPSCAWELIDETKDICDWCEKFEKLGGNLPKISGLAFLDHEETNTQKENKNLQKNKNVEFVLENIGKVVFLKDTDIKNSPENLSKEYADVFLINQTNFLEKGNISGFKFICKTVPKVKKETLEKLEGFLSDYLKPEEKIEADNILSLQYLEKFSIGNKKLAYLKADVDNLGLIFMSVSLDDYSLLKVCTLSRNLDLFFSLYLDKFFENTQPKLYEYIEKEEIPIDTLKSLVYTVYSGGDDLFFIAPWNVTCEFMKIIREKFEEYTCKNPSFGLSAGVGIFSGTFPVRLAAEITDNYESTAKTRDFNKNKICIFNCVLDWKDYIEVLEKLFKEENLSLLLKDKVISKSLIYKLYKYIKELKPYTDKYNKLRFQKNKTDKKIEYLEKKIKEKLLSFYPFFYYQISRNFERENKLHKQAIKFLENLILDNLEIDDNRFFFIDKVLFILSFLLMISREG